MIYLFLFFVLQIISYHVPAKAYNSCGSIIRSRTKSPVLAFYSHGVVVESKCDIYAKQLQSEMFQPGNFFYTCVGYVNNFIVGVIFSYILKIRNFFKVRRRDTLLDAVFHRRKGQGLLTVSNHQSILDDPGIWAAILPWWRMSPKKMRWSLCTEDVFFSVRSSSL